MQPTIQILDEPTINYILAQAKQILGEIGMEIQGPLLRQRLLAHGLKEDKGSRVRFPARYRRPGCRQRPQAASRSMIAPASLMQS